MLIWERGKKFHSYRLVRWGSGVLLSGLYFGGVYFCNELGACGCHVERRLGKGMHHYFSGTKFFLRRK